MGSAAYGARSVRAAARAWPGTIVVRRRARSAHSVTCPVPRMMICGSAARKECRPSRSGSRAPSRNTRQGSGANRSHVSTGSGGGYSSSTSGTRRISIASRTDGGVRPRRSGRRLRSRIATTPVLRDADVIPHRIVGRREIAPGKLSLLTIGLSEVDREARLHQLLAEIERMRRLIDVELVEDGLNVGAANEVLGAEDRDCLPIGEDAEVGVGDLRLELAQLGFRVAEHNRILHRE